MIAADTRPSFIDGAVKLLDMGYELSVARGVKGNQPYNPDHPMSAMWNTDPISNVDTLERRLNDPRTTGIGIVCNGVAGIDIDPNGHKPFAEFIDDHELPDTPMEAATPRAGRHLYYADRDSDVTNAGGLLGQVPGVDIRGSGAFLAAPPTSRDGVGEYSWTKPPVPVDYLPDAPNWLHGRAAIVDGELIQRAATTEWSPETTDWGRGQLTALSSRIIDAPIGNPVTGRHSMLISASSAAGHLIAEGDLTVEDATTHLRRAADQAINDVTRNREIERTIRDGLLYALQSRAQTLTSIIAALSDTEAYRG